VTPDLFFFRDLAYVFVAAVLGGVAAALARQPLILGYVAGGIVISPFTPGPALSDVHTFEVFAEIGVLLVLIVAGKLVIWTAVVWLFRYGVATALLVGAGLTQIGEFSFILVQVARAAGHVGADMYSATLAASLLSILLNAVLVRVVSARLHPRAA
jgi:predicted Kef-type K+ transport protein